MSIRTSLSQIFLVNSCYWKWSQIQAWSTIFLVNRLTLGLYHCNVHVKGTTWLSPQLQLLKVVKHSIEVWQFFVKLIAHHRPNLKSNCSFVNTLRAVLANFSEAKLWNSLFKYSKLLTWFTVVFLCYKLGQRWFNCLPVVAQHFSTRFY